MKIWKIKGDKNKVDIPMIERWIMETFDLSIEGAALYQMLLNEKYSIKPRKYFASKLRISDQTINRIIKKLKDVGALEVYKVKTVGNRHRTILIPLVDRAGLMPEESVTERIEYGIYDIEQEEGVTRGLRD